MKTSTGSVGIARGTESGPSAAQDVAVQVSHVYKVFGKHPKDVVRRLQAGENRTNLTSMGTAAVIDATFDVKKGEIFVVMGLSGSGKSTLIRMLNGLNPTTEGSIRVLGDEIVGRSARDLRDLRRDKMSMVFQHFALLPHRTVLDNVAYGLEIQGATVHDRRERARYWLDRVGLSDWADALPNQLSGGMQQRVGIARAFASDAEILLMDEAFSALDPLIRREMQEHLVELQAELGKTIVFITHDLNEAMFLGDRIAVMRDGRVVQVGTPNDILKDPANDYVAQFVQDVDRARVLSAGDVMEPARSVVWATSGPRAALHAMRRLQVSACYVIDERRTLIGVVRDKDMMRLVRSGRTDLTESLQPVPSIVRPDQLIANLFEMAAESSLPVAVVDNNERLLGVVPRVTLLASLANIPTTTAIPVAVPDIDPLTDAITDEEISESVQREDAAVSESELRNEAVMSEGAR